MDNGVMAKVRRFLLDTVAELGKCTWPGKSELFESTILVIVSIVALVAFTAVADQVSRWFVQFITGTL
ncbi:preprotein translocase subunit SecE [Lentisphaerota bacterium ZTH]|nr:preprotein translocase subunit SecE [Lentisphaerota bacterium ZTH]